MDYRPKVYITRQIPQSAVDQLLCRCNVSFWDSADPAPRSELLMNARGADVLLCMPTDKVDKQVLNMAGPSLKLVATMSDDSEHVDTVECKRRNIRVLNITHGSMETVADLTIALLLMVTVKWMNGENRNVNALFQQAQTIRSIKQDKAYCVELSNRTLGIISLGPLGLAVGKTLHDMGVAGILYNDTAPVVMAAEIDAEYVPLDELLEKSDIIFVCSDQKSTPSSVPVFTRETFKKMKQTSILIDATKQVVIDYNDMYDALRNGEIAAAGLDVREYDVIPNRHPLSSLDNCYFLPYRESYKWDGRRRLSEDLAKDILTTLKSIDA